MRNTRYLNSSALFIVLIYFIIGVVWIYYSDAAAVEVAKNSEELKTFQTYKGFFYIVLTAIILYFLVSGFLYSQYSEYFNHLQTIEVKNELQESLKQTHAMYKNLFDNMLDSVAHCRMIYRDNIPIDYEYIQVNKIFESMTGLVSVEGKKISELIPHYAKENPEALQVFGEVASGGKPCKWEHHLKALDQWYSFSIYCPKIGEFIVIGANITSEKKAVELVKEKDMILERTSKIAKVGGWEFDVATLEGRWTDELIRIHDLPLGEPIDVRRGIEFYTADSRPLLEQALQDLIQVGKPYDLELQIISALGIHKWVRVVGEPVTADGKIIKAQGVMQDITDRKIEEIEGERANTLLQTIVNSIPDAIYMKNVEGKYLLFNQGASEVTGKRVDEVIGNTDEALFKTEGAKLIQEIDKTILKEGTVKNQEEYLTTLLGEDKVFWVTKGPVYNPDGSLLGVFGISRDITEQKQHEIRLLEYKIMIDNLAEGVYAVDTNDRCTYMNSSGLKLLGLQEDAIIGKVPHDVFHYKFANGEHFSARECPINTAIERGEIVHIQHYFTRKDGTHFPVHVNVAPVISDQKHIGSVITFEDITQQLADQSRLLEEKERYDYMAHHDFLTGLPNRLALIEVLEKRSSQEAHEDFALMLIDLDSFKDINDSYGHRFGDQVLIKFMELLKASMPQDSFIVRTGGDEFVVLIACGNNKEILYYHIHDLMQKLQLPFMVSNRDVYITASIGIALYPLDAANGGELLQHADAAMYNAKKNGRNTFSFFSTQFTDNALSQVTISTNLKKALQNNELALFFQPQIDPINGNIVGVESLIRWFSIPPSVFIPIAEESGLIIEVGNFVLRECFKTAKEWSDSGIQFGRIAINIAAHQLMHSDFISTVEKLMAETECDPRWIELEITEGSIITSPEKVIFILEELRHRGFHISIDDFGTGYSSLSYLKNLPIDKLKIDISFVRNIMNEPKNQTIVKTIIALAKGLGLEVLAEGVETVEEMEFLKENGIDSIQGFYYHKPLSRSVFESMSFEEER